MGLEKVFESKLKELKEKHYKEEDSLHYLFRYFKRDYEKIKRAYENDFKEGEYNDEKLFNKFYESINELLNNYLQDIIIHSQCEDKTPEVKLGLISLEKVTSTTFANQNFAYKKNLTGRAKNILTEYVTIREGKILNDLKPKISITVIS